MQVDVQNYRNCRGIKLMSHTIKIWEKYTKKEDQKIKQRSESNYLALYREKLLQIYCLRKEREWKNVGRDKRALFIRGLEKGV